jgi:alpha-L-rhamnosidase
VVLDPAWTTYAKRVLYSAYDVSDIVAGSSAGILVSVELGNGYWSPVPMLMFRRDLRETLSLVGYPMVWLELHLFDSAGSKHVLSTADVGAWRGAQASSVVFDNVYLGQVTDNRLLNGIRGWTEAGFDDSAWAQAEVVNVTTGPLQLQDMPPVKTFTELPGDDIDVTDATGPGGRAALPALQCEHSRACGEREYPWMDDDDGSSQRQSDGLAVRMTRPDASTWVLDFGSDRTGVVDIEGVVGVAGHEINITFGEILADDGHVNSDSIIAASIGRYGPGNYGPCARVPAIPIDTVVLAGTSEPESFRPRFSWRVFRYAQINNWPTAQAGEPHLEQFRRVLMHTDIARAGHFASGLPLLARIRRMGDRAFLNNWVSIQGDCPGRERFGYGGDALVSGPASTRSWDVERFLRKRVRDYGDAQRENGAMTETAPFMGIQSCGTLGNGSGPVAWGAAHLFMQWLHWQQYGGTALLEEELGKSLAFVSLMNASRVKDVLYDGLSSFVLPQGFPTACDTAFGAVQGSSTLVSQARLAVELLRAIGAPSATVSTFQAVADTTQSAFQSQIFNNGTGIAGVGSMDEQVLALGFGSLRSAQASTDLSPAEAQAVGALERFWLGNGSLVVGSFVALAHQHAVDWGLGERMWAWVTNSSYPSYGWFLAYDATAMPEHWNNPTADYSWSHAWLGSVSQFLTDHVAGLRPGGVGASSLIAAPNPFGWREGSVPGVVRLPWAASSLLTSRGEMSTSWEVGPSAGLEGPFWLTLNVTLPPSSSNSAAFVPLASQAMAGNSTCAALPGQVCGCTRMAPADASARKLAALGPTAATPDWQTSPFDGWSLENSTGCKFVTAWRL